MFALATSASSVERIVFQRYPKWIDEQTGRRSDVPHHFVYNNASYGSNLQLRVACTVKRVVIE